MNRFAIVLAAAAVALLLVGAVASTAWLAAVSGQQLPGLQQPTGLLQAAPFPQEGFGQRNGIVVTGDGSVTVRPDLARVTLGVEVSNPSANAAQQEAAAKMDSVVAELKKQGIQERDIQTVRFDLSPEYDYSTRSPVLKGYRVTNLVSVTVRDLSRLGGLLDAVVASGATRLQGISFTVSDPAAAGAQGREEAMKSARAKADHLARLAGVSLGPPVAIEETVSAPPTPVEMRPAQAAPAAAAQTPISPGTQEIRTMVRVVYTIK